MLQTLINSIATGIAMDLEFITAVVTPTFIKGDRYVMEIRVHGNKFDSNTNVYETCHGRDSLN
tara:strand:- start:853 stop:1041 length:189 start_codon:yes stop_codon:yes gene_type:complete